MKEAKAFRHDLTLRIASIVFQQINARHLVSVLIYEGGRSTNALHLDASVVRDRVELTIKGLIFVIWLTSDFLTEN